MAETEIVKAKRHINLTKSERKDAARRKEIELAVSFFLDVAQDRTVAQIAAEMGIDVSRLKRITNDADFITVYDGALMDLGHHPRLKAAQSALPDLLPLAHAKLRQLLTGPRVADTAAVQAIKLLYETVNVKEMISMEDPGQLDTFLKSRGVSVGGDLVVNLNLPIPEEYQSAFHKMMRPDSHIVDGVVSTVDSFAPVPEGSSQSPGSPVSVPPDEEAPNEEVPS